MNLSLNLTPESAQRLLARARALGMTPDAYVCELVEHDLLVPASVSGDGEQARAFNQWADSFPDVPPLPDEALSRATLYPDRW